MILCTVHAEERRDQRAYDRYDAAGVHGRDNESGISGLRRWHGGEDLEVRNTHRTRGISSFASGGAVISKGFRVCVLLAGMVRSVQYSSSAMRYGCRCNFGASCVALAVEERRGQPLPYRFHVYSGCLFFVILFYLHALLKWALVHPFAAALIERLDGCAHHLAILVFTVKLAHLYAPCVVRDPLFNAPRPFFFLP